MTKTVRIKNILVGGGNPISVQSMTNTDSSDGEATKAQLAALQNASCDIARIAISSEKEVKAAKTYIGSFSMPLVADIQFDYKLAVACAEVGFDKIRINPGNIGNDQKVQMVVDACKNAKIPIRVGVNLGSLQDDLRALKDEAEALAKSALDNVSRLERMGFSDILISAKASKVDTCVRAYEIISKSTDYPLHIGVTESGMNERGIIRSAAGLGALLIHGIGDTIRVSLTGDPVNEVKVGRILLQELGIDKNFCEIISCPTCSRCKYDLSKIVTEIKDYTANIKVPVKIAIMGCVVNGPGEAIDADFGVAGGGEGKAVIFEKGKVVKTISSDSVIQELKSRIDAISNVK